MAGSILVRDVLKRVSTDLGDANPQFQRWKQQELVNAINDGQRAIAKYLPLSCARTDSVQLVSGSRQSIALVPAARIVNGDGTASRDVRGNMLQQVNCNMGVSGNTPGLTIALVDGDALDACSPGWRAPARSGKKPVEYVFNIGTPQTFYVNPGVPAGDSVWVELTMLADPAAIPNLGSEDYSTTSSSGALLSIDDKYIDDLHHYVMSRAHMKDAESQASSELAALNSTMFTNSINAQAKSMTGTNPNLTLLPMRDQLSASR